MSSSWTNGMHSEMRPARGLASQQVKWKDEESSSAPSHLREHSSCLVTTSDVTMTQCGERAPTEAALCWRKWSDRDRKLRRASLRFLLLFLSRDIIDSTVCRPDVRYPAQRLSTTLVQPETSSLEMAPSTSATFSSYYFEL